MSSIYIQEPPTSGKVLLKTTVGDIDLELWSKETPKACRNFVQLCLEGYYNGTIFHRVVKGFIVQGGDPTGTGTGGESIYGHPFKDEFHSRLRFNRRGLLAMANSDKDDNGSQYFFTLGPTPELQNKHTIFGKVTGETIFNMLKLEDALVDQDEKPLYPQKIIKTEVLSNPFPDIILRALPIDVEEKQEKAKKDKRSGVKNFKLLSFGEEAEEDEEETMEANKKFSGRSKSTHDVLNDPKLSSIPAVETKMEVEKDESDLSGDEYWQDPKQHNREEMENIRKKLKREIPEAKVKTRESVTREEENRAEEEQEEEEQEEEEDEEEETEEETEEEIIFDAESYAKEQKRMEDIRKQLREAMHQLKRDRQKKEEEQMEAEKEKKNEVVKNETLQEYKQEQEKYRTLKNQLPKKGASRQDFTLQLLAKFQKKLASAKEKIQDPSTSEVSQETSDAEKEDLNGDEWLAHKLHFESSIPVLAKDASTKNDDWFEIYDPRNPINKRRREASRDQLKNKARR